MPTGTINSQQKAVLQVEGGRPLLSLWLELAQHLVARWIPDQVRGSVFVPETSEKLGNVIERGIISARKRSSQKIDHDDLSFDQPLEAIDAGGRRIEMARIL